MTTADKIYYIEKLVAHYRELNEVDDKLSALFGHVLTDSPAFNPTWKAFDSYVQAVALLVGDTDAEWLFWFIWDNNCGEREMKAGYKNKLRPIKTVKQLVRLIEEGAK